VNKATKVCKPPGLLCCDSLLTQQGGVGPNQFGGEGEHNHGSNVGYFVDPDDNRYDDVVPGQSETSGVILFDSIFQGLAISLMAGEVAFPLLSRMTVPILYYLSATQGARAAG
jgi:hypothetical protein